MKRKTAISLLILLLAFPVAAFASIPREVVKLGDITSYTGDVLVRTKGAWGKIENVPYPVFSSDKVVTKRGRAEVSFLDGASLRMNVDSDLSIVQKQEIEGLLVRKKSTVRQVNVLVGDIYFEAEVKRGKALRYKVRSPSMTAAIRGSSLRMSVNPDGVTYFARLLGQIDTEGKFIQHYNPRPMSRDFVRMDKKKLPLVTNRSKSPALLMAEKAHVTRAEVDVSAPGAVKLMANAQLASAEETLFEAQTFGEAVGISQEAVDAIEESLEKMAGYMETAKDLMDEAEGASGGAADAYKAASDTAKTAADAELANIIATITVAVAELSGDEEAIETAQEQAGKTQEAVDEVAEKVERTVDLAGQAGDASPEEARVLALAAGAVSSAAVADSAEAFAQANVGVQATSGDSASLSGAIINASTTESLANTAGVAAGNAVQAAAEGDLDALQKAVEAAGEIENQLDVDPLQQPALNPGAGQEPLLVPPVTPPVEEPAVEEPPVEEPPVEEPPAEELPPDSEDLPTSSPSI
jgi:hypothetical protein